MPEDQSDTLIDFTIEIVSSYVGQNTIAADAVPAFITSIHSAVRTLTDPAPSAGSQVDFTPAVTVRKSLASPDHILSMIDGKPYKTLRRHITGHGFTVEQYRERFKLPHDYPMVAKSYSETRRALANKIGLGRKSSNAAPVAATLQEAKPAANKPKRISKPKTASDTAARPSGIAALRKSRDLLKIKTPEEG